MLVSVSENLVSEKKSWFLFRKICYWKKSLGIGFSQNFGIVIQYCADDDDVGVDNDAINMIAIIVTSRLNTSLLLLLLIIIIVVVVVVLIIIAIIINVVVINIIFWSPPPSSSVCPVEYYHLAQVQSPLQLINIRFVGIKSSQT